MKESQQDELPFAGDKQHSPRALLARERLNTIYEEFGFMPHTKRETNLAVGVLENKDKSGGFGRYLNEVLLHQLHANTEHAERAPIKIVSEVIGFARNTRITRTFIEEIDEELKGANSLSILKHVDSFSNWRHQSSTLHGLKELQRTVGTFSMLSDESGVVDIDKLGNNDAIADMMAVLRVHDARSYIKNLNEQELKRFSFWTEQLEVSARTHMTVAGMAYTALDSLGIKKPHVRA